MVTALSGIGITVTDHALYLTVTSRGAIRVVPVRQATSDGEQNEYDRTKEIAAVAEPRGANDQSRDRLRWPASFRNGGRHQIGAAADIKSESLAGLNRNSQTGLNRELFPLNRERILR